VWHVLGEKQINTGFWWRDVKERNDLEYLSIDGMVLINRSGGDWGNSGWG